MLDDNHSGMTSEIQKRISRRRMVRLTFSGAVHEWLLHLPRSKQRHLYVRLPVVEHVEVGILVDGERRVDPREDAGLAPGSKALNNRPVDLHTKLMCENNG